MHARNAAPLPSSGRPSRPFAALRPLALSLRLALAGLSVLPGLWPRAALAQAAAGRQYDIPAGSLTEVLNRFSEESGVFLTGSGTLTQGKTSPGLHGRYGLAEGYAEILRGQGLRVVPAGNGGYSLAPAPIPPEGEGAATTLPTVTVVGTLESPSGPGRGFVAESSLTGSKTDTPVLEIPQTLSVTTRAQLDAQQATNLTQAARYMPGVSFGDNTDTRNEYFNARGFRLDQYQDGLRLLTQGAWIENKIDPFFLDRIEVLEGPSSGLYGQSSPGGLVNLVSKRPVDTPFGLIQLQTGSYGRAQAGVDIGGRLKEDGSLLYRITGLARDAGAQVDRMREQRVAIAPALSWKGPDTTFTLLTSYLNDPRGGFWSSLPYSGSLLVNPDLPGGRLPRDLNTGQPSFEEFKRERASIGYELEHRFNDNVKFQQNFRYTHVNSTYNSLQADDFIAGTSIMERNVYMYEGQANTAALDNRLLLDFRTGALQHKALVGLDYQYVDRHDKSRYGPGPSLDVLAPNYDMAVPVPNVNLDQAQKLEQLGAYVQDQITWNRVVLTLTGREDYASTKTHNNLAGSQTNQYDSRFTGRAGLTYLFDNGIAPYVSYSTSFVPSSGLSFGGDPFKPTTGTQYEVGIKYKPSTWNALFTASAFHLTQQNVLTADPEHLGFQVQTGEVRARGIELSALASLARGFDLTASYAYVQPKITRDNGGLEGKDLVNTPRNLAKLWLDYTVQDGPLAGLGIGAGVRYIGQAYANTQNVDRIPDATLFDAALRYDLSHVAPGLKGWKVAVNASNLADKKYVADCSNFNCRWGQGRTIYATATYQW